MASDPNITAGGLQEAKTYLREVVATKPCLWTAALPGVHGVTVTHVEDGWVDLSFHGYSSSTATTVANELLHPEALLTSDFIFRLTDEDGLHFQGFGWEDEPPAGVLARRHPAGPPALSVAIAEPEF